MTTPSHAIWIDARKMCNFSFIRNSRLRSLLCLARPRFPPRRRLHRSCCGDRLPPGPAMDPPPPRIMPASQSPPSLPAEFRPFLARLPARRGAARVAARRGGSTAVSPAPGPRSLHDSRTRQLQPAWPQALVACQQQAPPTSRRSESPFTPSSAGPARSTARLCGCSGLMFPLEKAPVRWLLSQNE
jgi:hypothetical protein